MDWNQRSIHNRSSHIRAAAHEGYVSGPSVVIWLASCCRCFEIFSYNAPRVMAVSAHRTNSWQHIFSYKLSNFTEHSIPYTPHFMKTKCSLPRSQQSSICSYRKTNKSVTHLSMEDPFKYYATIYAWILYVVFLFPPPPPPNTRYSFLFSPTHATCPVALNLRKLITLEILCKQYKSWNSSLESFCSLHVLHPS